MENCNGKVEIIIAISGALICSFLIFLVPHEWFLYAGTYLSILILGVLFYLRLYVDKEKGIKIKYLINASRNRNILWENISHIKEVSKMGEGHDIHIFLKSGEEVKFSPIGLKLNTLELLNKYFDQWHIEQYKKKKLQVL